MWYFIGAYCFLFLCRSTGKHFITTYVKAPQFSAILSVYNLALSLREKLISVAIYVACFFSLVYLFTVYGSHPFLRPLIYSYVHTLDTFNYFEILFFLPLSFGISLKCRYWICVGWTPHKAGLKWLRGITVSIITKESGMRTDTERAWWKFHPLM